MTKSPPTSFGHLEVHLSTDMRPSSAKPEPDVPFRMIILGDFSGRGHRQVDEKAPPLRDRKPIPIDRDNVDDVMKRLGVEVHLSLTEQKSAHLPIRFAAIEAFHPDRLVNDLAHFQALRQLRQQLNNPTTFDAAAVEVQSWFETKTRPVTSSPPEVTPTTPSKPAVQSVGAGSLLDQMLEEAETPLQQAERIRGTEEWQAFLQTLVAPHLVPGTPPQQAELVADVDAGLSTLMRTILHHPDFQTIEAAWQSLWFLIQRLETDRQLQLYILDVSKKEVAEDLFANEDLQSTGLYRLLVEQTVEIFGGQPWSVVGGNYTFDKTKEDAVLLGRIAKIAQQAGAPFIAGANSTVVGCQAIAETPDPRDWRLEVNQEDASQWEALRGLPEAIYLGLTFPRFLLRLPYGQETEPVSGFDFEELVESPEHEAYLWGSPMFACVLLMGQAFTDQGWNMRPGTFLNIEGVPLHLYKEDGESCTKPCAEVLLTDRTTEQILEQGVMPLVSVKDRDAVHLARVQSLASPLQSLMGRWA